MTRKLSVWQCKTTTCMIAMHWEGRKMIGLHDRELLRHVYNTDHNYDVMLLHYDIMLLYYDVI